MAKRYGRFDPLRKELDDLLNDLKDTNKNLWDSMNDIKKNVNLYKKKVVKSSKPPPKPQEKERTDDIINNEKIKKMNVGQGNLKEASKYTRFYGYKVKVVEHRYPDKRNYVFTLDNAFFKKLLNKPTDRFNHQVGQVGYHSLVFKYNPKRARELVDDQVIYFEAFEIVLDTSGCHDLIYFHTENNGSNKESLKALYILNLQKVIDKLKGMYDGLHLSEKAKTNMILSVKKHLASTQAPERYGVDEYEEFNGYGEERALMVLDDFDDGDLADSLGGYIFE